MASRRFASAAGRLALRGGTLAGGVAAGGFIAQQLPTGIAFCEPEQKTMRDMIDDIRDRVTAIGAKVGLPGLSSEPEVTVATAKDSAHFLADQTHPKVRQIAATCRYYGPAFSPKAVPFFYDLSGITENPAAFKAVVDIFVARYRAQPAEKRPTVVVGYDARGFVLGPPIALALGLPFVLLRKQGKNPGPLVDSTAYSKEYKEKQPDKMCVRLGAVKKGDRVLLVDDLIATGGTALSGFELCDALGAEVAEFASIIEIPVCNGVEKIRAWPAALADDGKTVVGKETGKFKDVPIFSVLDSATVHALRPSPDDPAGWAEPSKQVAMKDAGRIMERYGLGR